MKNVKTLILASFTVLALAGCAANAQTSENGHGRSESTFRHSQSK